MRENENHLSVFTFGAGPIFSEDSGYSRSMKGEPDVMPGFYLAGREKRETDIIYVFVMV